MVSSCAACAFPNREKAEKPPTTIPKINTTRGNKGVETYLSVLSNAPIRPKIANAPPVLPSITYLRNQKLASDAAALSVTRLLFSSSERSMSSGEAGVSPLSVLTKLPPVLRVRLWPHKFVLVPLDGLYPLVPKNLESIHRVRRVPSFKHDTLIPKLPER